MGKKNRGLTGGLVISMTTDSDVPPIVDWVVLANLKPSMSNLESNSPSLSLDVSYPHPLREFKLLKREEVYNLDVMVFKRRCLGKKTIFTS